MQQLLKSTRRKMEPLKEFIVTIISVLLIFQFVVTLAYVPSGSMENTLNIGDRLIVNRIPYYYKNPERGDIVIFHHGEDSYVKRVIAIAGDTIDMDQGSVILNGEKIDESAYLKELDVTYRGTIEMPYTVPEEHYFVMGDNRMNSADSRSFGPIERSQIYAKAWFKVYPFNEIGKIR